MAEAMSTSAPVNGYAAHLEEPSSEVFAVFGAEPEVQAYAMAKYSRSSLSMKESLREISTQKAEKFLNTFYFQYGHRSIADLAHIALAIEPLSGFQEEWLLHARLRPGRRGPQALPRDAGFSLRRVRSFFGAHDAAPDQH